MDLDSNVKQLHMKRKQENDEGKETSEDLLAVKDSRVYRTAKRRRKLIPEAESSQTEPHSMTSCSEASDVESSDSEDDWSSWGSDESDVESDALHEITSAETDKVESTDPSGAAGAQETTTTEEYEKLFKEEDVALGTLMNFWSSQVATKARKELGFKADRRDLSCSPEVKELQLKTAEKLLGLPCVLTVGVKKDGSQINVSVSDKNKALELSEELSGPNINLTEARNVQFF